MLGKLFKYEFKNTAKVILTIYAMLIVTTLIGCLALRGAFRMSATGHDNSVISLFLAAALILYILSIFAFFIIIYVYMCMHFYKTMYSAQGYLTHTLPVKQLTTFHVKLATSFVWLFLSVLLFLASVFLLINVAADGDRELAAMSFNGVGLPLWIFASLILSCLTYLLWVFASASIGQLFSSNKALASVGTGVILYIVNQILNLIVTFIAGSVSNKYAYGGIFQTIIVTDTANIPIAANNTLMIVQTLYAAVVVIVLYVICNVIVRRHINLE